MKNDAEHLYEAIREEYGEELVCELSDDKKTLIIRIKTD